MIRGCLTYNVPNGITCASFPNSCTGAGTVSASVSCGTTAPPPPPPPNVVTSSGGDSGNNNTLGYIILAIIIGVEALIIVGVVYMRSESNKQDYVGSNQVSNPVF